MMADLYKFGVATHIYKPLIKRGVVDFAVGADFTPAAGDVKISKDGGAAANVTNLPTAIVMGNTAMWDYSLTATEMQAAKVRISVADSATKAVEDNFYEIDTYGNPSAQHLVDLTVAAMGAVMPATAGRTLVVDAAGLADANVVKLGPTGAGTAQTARDIGTSVLTPLMVRQNTAQAGGAASITLDAAATNLHCQPGDTIFIVSGTGALQSNTVNAFDNTTKIASMLNNWVTNPNNTSVFQVWKTGGISPALVTDVWNDTLNPTREPTGFTTAAKAQINTEVASRLATALADSYAIDGAQPTMNQAVLTILQILTEAVVSGNNIVINKPDGVTPAITITCAPTVAGAMSRTRSA